MALSFFPNDGASLIKSQFFKRGYAPQSKKNTILCCSSIYFLYLSTQNKA